MLTLYERSITSKFCSFRVLSQEFGGKSKKMAVTWGLRASLFRCMVEAIQVTQIIVAIQAIALAVVMMMMIVVMTMMVMMTMMMMGMIVMVHTNVFYEKQGGTMCFYLKKIFFSFKNKKYNIFVAICREEGNF